MIMLTRNKKKTHDIFPIELKQFCGFRKNKQNQFGEIIFGRENFYKFISSIHMTRLLSMTGRYFKQQIVYLSFLRKRTRERI
jgi:hypothetical protein